MTGVSALLDEVRAAGVRLWIDGGKLRIKVPHGVLTTALRDQLTAHRAEIATLLAEPANDRTEPDMSGLVRHPLPPNDGTLRDMSRSVPPVPVETLPASLKAAFEERAAITEVDGGLNREAAERVAEVTSGPAGDDVTAWRAWMHSRLPVWQARGLSRSEAMRSVWSEAEDIWRHRHGAPPDPDRCAGCGEWMLDGPGMRFDDGTVVHFGNPDRLDCLILYGEAWRAAASAGLVALGLRKPA